ncbi:hypothetical protein DSM26151_06570 [Agromyces marinus]|uniref:DUF305 domain-containing protein n=1 Tax=Agromyces marinus TaxID=1389020 RepID=A0ABM8GZV5_9MICO|nr:hypothetical protein DSM26151_06570 [Agromyces marinus]BDZ54029.1 hypothetical protein GCM10025870_11020 [Agromyces marinus]
MTLAAAAALTLAACSPSPAPADGPGAAEGTTGTAGGAGAASAPANPNDADRHFFGMMTPHHEQAVVMSDVVLAASGISGETRDLAQRIKDGQQPEIDTMTAWLDAWGWAGDLDVHRTHIMGGMLTPDQMAEFEAADGAKAERLFLVGMLQHHEGAIAMTQDSIENGAVTGDLAQQMMDVQTAEIEEMRALLG